MNRPLRFSTELHKGIERINQPITIEIKKTGIRTYNNESLSYAKQSLELVHHDFTKVPVSEKECLFKFNSSKVAGKRAMSLIPPKYTPRNN